MFVDVTWASGLVYGPTIGGFNNLDVVWPALADGDIVVLGIYMPGGSYNIVLSGVMPPGPVDGLGGGDSIVNNLALQQPVRAVGAILGGNTTTDTDAPINTRYLYGIARFAADADLEGSDDITMNPGDGANFGANTHTGKQGDVLGFVGLSRLAADPAYTLSGVDWTDQGAAGAVNGPAATERLNLALVTLEAFETTIPEEDVTSTDYYRRGYNAVVLEKTLPTPPVGGAEGIALRLRKVTATELPYQLTAKMLGALDE